MGRYKNNKDGTLDLIAGIGDTSALANKTDLTAIVLTGATNTSGDVISAGTWFYLNGKPCIAKVDIASDATFTEGTNYEKKTVGSALSELNSYWKLVGCYHANNTNQVGFNFRSPNGTTASIWLNTTAVAVYDGFIEL